jgi:steroid delta-isomerase-like uncharacterized protein
MSTEQNKAIVLRFFEEAFNQGNFAVINELIASHFVYHAPGVSISGSDGVHQLVTWMRTTFHDFHVSPEDVVAEGDRVVIRFTDCGTHQGEGMGIPPTGQQVTWTGMDIFRLTDGKIVEGWGVSDSLHLMQQLGALPPLG